jgi:hypothetical protein
VVWDSLSDSESGSGRRNFKLGSVDASFDLDRRWDADVLISDLSCTFIQSNAEDKNYVAKAS